MEDRIRKGGVRTFNVHSDCQRPSTATTTPTPTTATTTATTSTATVNRVKESSVCDNQLVPSSVAAFPSIPPPDPSRDPSLVPKSVEEKSEGEGAERKEEEEEVKPKQKVEGEDRRENSVDGKVVSPGKVDSDWRKGRDDSVVGGYQRTTDETGSDDPGAHWKAPLGNDRDVENGKTDDKNWGNSREISSSIRNGPVANESIDHQETTGDTSDTPKRGRGRRSTTRPAEETDGRENESEQHHKQHKASGNQGNINNNNNNVNNKRAPEDDHQHQTKKHITRSSGEQQQQQTTMGASENKTTGMEMGTQKVESTKRRASRAWARKGSGPQLVSLEGSSAGKVTAAAPPATASGGVPSEAV